MTDVTKNSFAGFGPEENALLNEPWRGSSPVPLALYGGTFTPTAANCSESASSGPKRSPARSLCTARRVVARKIVMRVAPLSSTAYERGVTEWGGGAGGGGAGGSTAGAP